MTHPNDPSANAGSVSQIAAQGSQDGRQRVTPEYAHNNAMTDAFGKPVASYDSGYMAGFSEAERTAAQRGNAFDRAGMTDRSTGSGAKYDSGSGSGYGYTHREMDEYQGGSYDTGFQTGDLSANPTYTSADGVTAQRLFDHPTDPIDPETGKASLGTAGNLALGTAGIAGGAAIDRAVTKRAAANATTEQMRDAVQYNVNRGHADHNRYLNSRSDRKLADEMARGREAAHRETQERLLREGTEEAEKAAKQAAKEAGEEFTEEAAEKTGKKAAKEVAEEATEKAGKKAGKRGAKQMAKQGAKQAAKATGKLAGKAGTRAAAGVAGRLGARAGLMAAGAAVPGPGWALAAGVAATVVLEAAFNPGFRSWVGGLVRSGGVAVDTPPEPPYTHWLPHIEDDKRAEVVDAVDQTITEMNATITGVDPAEYKMWDVTGGNEVPGLTRMLPVADHINHVAGQLNTFSENMQSLMTGSESSIMQNYAEALQPALNTIASFNEDAGQPLTDAVIQGATTANEAYQLILDANQKSRETLAKSRGDWLHVIPKSSVEQQDLVTNAEDIKAKVAQLQGQQAEIEKSVLAWVNKIDPAEIDPKAAENIIVSDHNDNLPDGYKIAPDGQVIGPDGRPVGPNPNNIWQNPIAPGSPMPVGGGASPFPSPVGGGGGGGFRASGGGTSPFAPLPGGGGDTGGGRAGGSTGKSVFDTEGGIFGDNGSGDSSPLGDGETKDVKDLFGGGDSKSIFDTGDDTAGGLGDGDETKDVKDLFGTSDGEGIFDTGDDSSGGLGVSDGSGDGVTAREGGSIFDTDGTDTGNSTLPGGASDYASSSPFDTGGSSLFDTELPGGGSDYGASSPLGTGGGSGLFDTGDGLGVSDGAGGGIGGGAAGGIFDDYDAGGSGSGLGVSDGSGVFGDDDSTSTSAFDPSSTGSGSSGGLGAFGSTGFDENGNPISRGDATGLTGGGSSAFDPDGELDGLFGDGDGANGNGSNFDPDADPAGDFKDENGGDPFGSTTEDYDPFGVDSGSTDGTGGDGLAGEAGTSPLADNGAGGGGGTIGGGEPGNPFGDGADGAGGADGGGGAAPGGGDGVFGDGAGGAGGGDGIGSDGDATSPFAVDGEGDMPGEGADAGEGAGGPAEGAGLFDDMYGENGELKDPATMAAAANMSPEELQQAVTVDVHGEERQFLNPETAELARRILDPAIDTSSIPFADLAEQVGITMPDNMDGGINISPAEAQPGDMATVNGKDWLYVGEGQLIDPVNGEVAKVGDIIGDGGFAGEGEGFFRMDVDDGKLLDQAIGGAVDGVEVPEQDSAADETPRVDVPTDTAAAPLPGETGTGSSSTFEPGAADSTSSMPTATADAEPSATAPAGDAAATPESSTPESTAPGTADAAPANDTGADTREFQRTAEAPIGMGAGQNVPTGDNPVAAGGASAGGVEAGRGGSYSQGAQAATDTSASSAGPRETEFEGQALGGPAQTRTSGAGDVPAPSGALDPNDII